MKYLLDTNICIYIIKNKYIDIVKKLDRVGIDNVAVSSITVAELEYGISKSSKPKESEEKLYEFLVPFEILDFNVAAARYYGKLRGELTKNGNLIGSMDMLIASIALANDLRIVTNNEKEFERIPNLKIENWIKKVP